MKLLILDSSSSSSSGGANNPNSSGAAANEIGVVEKLLNGYGFIKCYNRDQPLFFSQPYYYQGPVNGLKVGEIVEFEPVFDRKSGKTVATNIVRHQDKLNQKRLQQQQHLKMMDTLAAVVQQQQLDVPNINLTNLKVLFCHYFAYHN
jgi:cold shock CspA family protein